MHGNKITLYFNCKCGTFRPERKYRIRINVIAIFLEYHFTVIAIINHHHHPLAELILYSLFFFRRIISMKTEMVKKIAEGVYGMVLSVNSV